MLSKLLFMPLNCRKEPVRVLEKEKVLTILKPTAFKKSADKIAPGLKRLTKGEVVLSTGVPFTATPFLVSMPPPNPKVKAVMSWYRFTGASLSDFVACERKGTHRKNENGRDSQKA